MRILFLWPFIFSNCFADDTSVSDKLKTDLYKALLSDHRPLTYKQANGIAKSDLHHLFPVDSPTNSIRSSLPFCDVIESKWSNSQSKRGFNSFKEHCFEPPEQHKGNVARALFYFSVRYQMPIDDNQESYLRKWCKQDPIDQDEIDRNDKIKSFQYNSNPFIERPELIEQIKNF